MTLGVQIQKKAQIESGSKKREDIQRKIKEAKRVGEEIHMALMIGLEKEAAREPAPLRQQEEMHREMREREPL